METPSLRLHYRLERARSSHVQQQTGSVRPGGARDACAKRGFYRLVKSIDKDLYDVAAKSHFERLNIRYSLPISEHLPLLVRDWRGRLLRLEDHGFEDGSFRSVS